MTKSELIAQLAAENPHLRPDDIDLIVATIFEEVTAALARGQRVELRGFGAVSSVITMETSPPNTAQELAKTIRG